MLALLSGITWLARATVIVDFVDALAVVLARLCGALVYVVLASGASPSWMAYALMIE